jgi:predicted amidohydrolase YtcJ
MSSRTAPAASTGRTGDRSWWLVDVRRPGSSDRYDVRVDDGVLTAFDDHDPSRRPGDRPVLDADGRWLIPGLYDAHVHATQYAVQQGRIDLTAAGSAAEAVRMITAALDSAERAAETGPVIGAGFRDGLWPEAPDKALLDEAFGDRPVILISGDLHCGWLNSAGLAMIGHPSDATGVLREQVWMDALARLPQPAPDVTDRWIQRMLHQAVARGLTGLRDFEFADNLTVWERRHRAGGVPVRVDCGVMAPTLSAATTRGMRAGDPLPGSDDLITLGPVKVFVDGSLNTRTALCHDPYPGGDQHGETVLDHAALIAIMDAAAAYGLQMAVHAIGDLANTIALDCFQQTGISGRIEHAQLLTEADLPRFAALGVVAGMQPWHAVDDWPVADHYWQGRTGRAFPFAALLRSGATVEFGSDAPVAPLDPWRAIAAAVDRAALIGRSWHPEQQVGISEAIACSTRTRGRLRIGDPADLVLLDADPVGLRGTELINIAVQATAVAGRWLHGPAEIRS